MVHLTLQPIFMHLRDVTYESPSEDLRYMWSVLAKAKSFIPQGDRLENLSWRLWYASENGFKGLVDSGGRLEEKAILKGKVQSEELSIKSTKEKIIYKRPGERNAHFIENAGKAPVINSEATGEPFSREASPIIFKKEPFDILQSLTSVLEEIRDSVPIPSMKRNSPPNQPESSSFPDREKPFSRRKSDKKYNYTQENPQNASLKPIESRVSQSTSPNFLSKLMSDYQSSARKNSRGKGGRSNRENSTTMGAFKASKSFEGLLNDNVYTWDGHVETAGLTEMDQLRQGENESLTTTFPFQEAQFLAAAKAFERIDGSIREEGSLSTGEYESFEEGSLSEELEEQNCTVDDRFLNIHKNLSVNSLDSCSLTGAPPRSSTPTSQQSLLSTLLKPSSSHDCEKLCK